MPRYKDSTPDPEAIGRFLKGHYRIPRGLECRLLAKRRGCLYQVNAGSWRALFKLLPVWESNPRETSIQLGILDFAKGRGVRVQTAWATRKAKGAVLFRAPEGLRVGVLFKWMPGVDSPKKWTPRLRRAYGALLADFQAAAREHSGPRPVTSYDFDYMVAESLRQMKPWLKPLPKVYARFQKSASWVREALSHLPKDAATWGTVYGDAHGGNLRFKDGRFSLVDTDQVGQAWRVYDVATYCWGQYYWLAWGGKPDEKMKKENLEAFMLGYESRRPLSALERRCIPALMVARDFWLTRMYCQGSGAIGDSLFEGLNYFRRSIKYHELIRKKREYFGGSEAW